MFAKTIEWLPSGKTRLTPGAIRLIDQTLLPGALVYKNIRTLNSLWRAIRLLQVRGAPAIGVAAAMGMVIAAQCSKARSGRGIAADVRRASAYLATSRPTAVNLFWALQHMCDFAERHSSLKPEALRESMAREAIGIMQADLDMCRSIGEHGLGLLRNGMTVLTHCNAGALATSGYGTALAPLYLAQEQGWHIKVYADETRPLLQGARLTAWEMKQAGIPVTLICDNTAAVVMAQGKIDAVLVGADRIAANGDTANKVGTYGLAVLARAHGIPFYVLAPASSFDLALDTGAKIPIEERAPEEVTCGFGLRTAPRGVAVYSPAFDVTPSALITAIVCEAGVLYPPFGAAIRGAFKRGRGFDGKKQCAKKS